MDPDDQRLWDGGSETSTYEAMSDEDAPYRPKNAPFDTVDEIRLVEGWNNDGVWARFGQHLTIYGSGRVNVNTADRRIMEALLRRFVQPVPTEDSLALIWQQIQMFRSTPMTAQGGGGVWHDVGNFVAFLRQVVPGTIDPQIEQLCATSSTVFRVRSTGMVGEASVTQTAVFQFPQTQQGQPGQSRLAGAFGRVLYWHVQ
jgi:type II secretory pathway component PulK